MSYPTNPAHILRQRPRGGRHGTARDLVAPIVAAEIAADTMLSEDTLVRRVKARVRWIAYTFGLPPAAVEAAAREAYRATRSAVSCPSEV